MTTAAAAAPHPYEGSHFPNFSQWYTREYCGDEQAQTIAAVQSWGSEPLRRFLTDYLTVWTRCADGEGYVVVCVGMIIFGYTSEAVYTCIGVALATYAVDVLKDLTWLPRPPSPPVRRKVCHAHQVEYGMPSTHTVMATMFSYLMLQVAASTAPEWFWHVFAFCATFAAHATFSRYYLGAHWIADIVVGFLLVAALIAIDLFCIRPFVASRHLREDQISWWHLALPLVAGRALLLFHATPRDACPCFVDSCRFLGVSGGFASGALLNMLWIGRVSRIAPWGNDLTMWTCIGAIMNVVICVAVMKVGPMILSPLLPPLLRFASGASSASVPRPLRGLYATGCVLVGLALVKPIQFNRRGRAREPLAAPDAEVHSVWSTTINRHWSEALALTKLLTYFAVGLTAVAFGPYLIDMIIAEAHPTHHVAGPGRSPSGLRG